MIARSYSSPLVESTSNCDYALSCREAGVEPHEQTRAPPTRGARKQLMPTSTREADSGEAKTKECQGAGFGDLRNPISINE